LLQEFLEKKPLYYKEIDYTRMPRAWKSVKKYFELPKIIHVIGTNAKGSTGRFLAHFLYKNGYKVGHYTSPHILKFNERIWLDGADVSDKVLEESHLKLLSILSKDFQDSLSYFEYTTLLSMIVFQDCDYIVLEAGLGGEYDATSVFESDLTLVTPISIDHEAFLGDSIKKIATTKLNAIRKFAVIGKQSYKEVYKVAKKLSRDKKIESFRYDFFFGFDEIEEAKESISKLNMADFFVDNLLLAMAGAKFFGFNIDFSKFEDFKLVGRCQKISNNVTIDVGHNNAAAIALLSHFENSKIVLIYNSYADKDYEQILKTLKPIIQRVELLPILNERVEQIDILQKVLSSLEIEFKIFDNIKADEEYLVFGSFTVVEEFLNHHGYETR